MRQDLTQYGAGLFKFEHRAEPYQDVKSNGRKLDALNERLAVRLGRDHLVCQAFAAADEGVLDVFRAVGLFKLEDEAEDEEARRALRKVLQDTQAKANEARDKFDDGREKFLAQAQRLAGARIDTK